MHSLVISAACRRARLFCSHRANGSVHPGDAIQKSLLMLAGAILLSAGTPHASLASAPDLTHARTALATLGVPFVPNLGQWDSRAAFAARTLSGMLFVTTEGELVYSLPAPGSSTSVALPGARPERSNALAWALSETFVSAAGTPRRSKPDGERPMAAKMNYLTGNDTNRHRTDIGTYESVNLGDVFEGVNIQLRATGSNVEKIFTVAPQRDPRHIRVRLDGATRLEVDGNGALIAHTGNGPVTYTAPIALQEAADGTHRDVDVRYVLDTTTRTYGFALGEYDHSRPLVIDPLLKTVYLGGSGSERANALAVHPHTGYVYVAGFTTSSANDFPGVTGEYDATSNGGTDAFVSRLSPDLSQLAGSTYFGGSGTDSAIAMAIHPDSGDIYVALSTQSVDMPSGQIAGAQSATGGGFDAFVARFSADLKTLKGATYLGGTGDEFSDGIAIHPFNGDVYVVGETNSSPSPTNDFPVTGGAVQTAYGGGRDAFVTRFSADLSSRVQSTFLGGSQSDSAHAIAIHPGSGDVFVVGDTSSANFPGVTAGSAQASLNGSSDAFVARLNSALSSVASTYLGAGAGDSGTAVAMNPLSGEVIVAGLSNLSASGPAFPGLSGAPQAVNAGGGDAFVSRLNTALTAVLRSTYLGSVGDDSATGVAVNGDTGEIYITGTTNGAAFATPATADEAYQPIEQSANDIYVARYRYDLAERLQVTYLGTNNNEAGQAIAIHPVGGSVLVAGSTGASAFPGATPGSPTSYGGGFDAIVAMFTPDLTAYNTIPAPFAFAPQSSVAGGDLPNTTRQSNEVRLVITPTPPINVPAYVIGAAGSEICATNTAGCCTKYPAACSGFVSGWVSPNYRFLSGDYIAVRHPTPMPVGVALTRFIVGGVATVFESSSGDATIRCNLDATGNTLLDALTEGLLLERAMAGLTGTATTNATGITTPWATLRDQMNSNCGTNFQ